MSALETAAYGAWRKPLSARALTRDVVDFEELLSRGREIWWVEQRPGQEGRSTLVAADGLRELTPPPASVGSRVHEYGGAAVLVDGQAGWFVEQADQRIYRISPEGELSPITPPGERRYGDLALDRPRGRLLAVCEDHGGDGDSVNSSIVAVPLAGGTAQTVLAGRDFYLAPRVSPDGERLAWLCWDFPQMPWDGTELYVADLDPAGRPGPPRLVAGGLTESVCHPQWSPDNVLHFLSDRTGWWNLYTDGEDGPDTALAPVDADVGQATAMGHSPYDVDDRRVVAALHDRGTSRLVTIDRSDGRVDELTTGLTEVAQPRLAGDDVVFLGGAWTRPGGVWRHRGGSALPELLRPSSSMKDGNLAFLGDPEHLEIPARDGCVVHAFYHRPRSPYFVGPDGERPPLLVSVHGGPVSRTTTALAFGRQAVMAAAFWTSRGYAVLDVDYRGSLGYGRGYREALYERWGELDVDDCIDAAHFLVERGDVDGGRVAIRGPSAGGYTTLAALAFRDYFAAGTAYFPVADLESFQATTHKYEARYDEQLIGGRDRHRSRYRDRSPLLHAAEVSAPVLVLQGLDDRVCPPDQTRSMVARLQELGRDAELVLFEGEGHGFVREDNIVTSLEREAAFYGRVLRLC